MRSVSVGPARHPRLAAMASALRAFAVECGALAACLVVYLGALAAIAVAAALFVTHWNFDDGLAQLHLDAVLGVAEPRQGWRPDPDAPPAFAVSQFDIAGITATYEVARDGGDGRRDILRWTHGATPVAGVRIDRPGPETPPAATMATFAEAGFHPELPLGEAAAAGVIESKFGPVKLFDLVDRSGAAMSCLGFVRTFAGPSLRLKGWSCQGETPAARRAAVVCLLNRLVLLKAGHDARLAELFARAELRRTDCGGAAPRVAGDWIVSARDPRLRGAL